MKEKKPQTTEVDQWEAWAQRTYRTGGTQPPKSHGGLIAFLLVLVIFLCGVSTALGLMNIHLFRQLNAMVAPANPPVVFSRENAAFDQEESAPLGFIGQTVSDFWQNYHDLPQGVYITQVIPESDAYAQGVHPGDILISFNHIPVTDTETLQSLLAEYTAGDCVLLCIYRAGQELELSIILQ